MGNNQSRMSATSIGNNRLWNGREYDAETGLYYYRTRYLDPRTGRFTTRDTIGIWGDPTNLGNGYTYAGNNPWTYVDPYGLFEWSESWMENAWSMAKGAGQAVKNAAVDAATGKKPRRRR